MNDGPERHREGVVAPDEVEESAREADREARLRVQTCFDRPLLLEAGAGTGKTTTLVNRLLAWCLGPGWSKAEADLDVVDFDRGDEPDATDRIATRILDRLVAITFTEAAASEMASRFAEGLATLEDDGQPLGLLSELAPIPDSGDARQSLRGRARALLAAFDHLTVETIHAFCRRLLARYPVEVGLHPDFVVDAESEVLDKVVREVVEEGFSKAFAEPIDPYFQRLAVAGIGPPEVAMTLSDLTRAGVATTALGPDPHAPECIGELRTAMLERLDALLAAEDGRLQEQGFMPATVKAIHDLANTRNLAESRLEGGGQVDLAAVCTTVRDLWESGLKRKLRSWSAGDFNRTESRCLGDRREQFAVAAGGVRTLMEHLSRMRVRFLDAARRALEPLVEAVHARMRARGAETFNGLLIDALELLQQQPRLLRRVRMGIDQLLVDEFQDTDPVQCGIIGAIALEGPRAERPGLFLVGDPKQSIYGWRQADLGAYGDFRHRLEACEGEVRSLTVNFRSTPAILREVERVIAPVMQERAGVQPRFRPLLASEERALESSVVDGSRAAVEYWVSWQWDMEVGEPMSTLAAEATGLEASALASDLLDLHRRQGVAWRQIGVLFRSSSDLDVYVEQLRRAGVPYVVQRDRNYYRRREIIEASGLVRCILDPTDTLALMTTLRAVTVGVPDAALIPLWARGLPEQLANLGWPSSQRIEMIRRLVREAAAEVPAEIPGIERIPGWEISLIAAVEHLAVLRTAFQDDPSDVFVEKVRASFLVEAVEAARHLGSYRVANLDRFFRRLQRSLEGSVGDHHVVLRELRRSIGQALEAEEATPTEKPHAANTQ